MIPALATTGVAFFGVIVLTALGDVQRPTQGYQIGDVPDGPIDIVLPLLITQCDPVIIYYNISFNISIQNIAPTVTLFTADEKSIFLYFILPVAPAIGYYNWICDIPAGYSFFVNGYGRSQYYTVQPGSSSACLGNVTTTYSYVEYSTVEFQSYTQQSPSGDSSHSSRFQQPTIAFPTSSFPTITANPNLAVTSTLSSPTTTTTSAASSQLFSPPTPSPSVSPSTFPDKSNTAVIVGGVVGGIAFVLFVVTIIFVFLRKRRKNFSNAALEFATPYSGSMTSRLRPTPTPLLPSSNPIDPVRRGGKFKIRRTVVSDTRRRIYVPSSKSRDRGADLASALDIPRLTAGQRQALIVSLSALPPTDATEPPSQSSPGDVATQEDLPDIATILDVISRAQLSLEERHALVASLNNLLLLDQAPPAALTRRSIPSLPPPYAE